MKGDIRMYEERIDSFVDGQKFSESEARHFKGDLKEFCKRIHEPITIENYSRILAEHKAYLMSKKLKPKSIENKKSHAAIFVSAIIKETQINMTFDNETQIEQVTTPDNTEAITQETSQTDSVIEPEAVSSKRGRPKKEGNYTERISIYVTPELDAQFNAVCECMKISKTEFIVKILEKHMCEYEELIAEYLEKQKKIQKAFMK